MIFQFLGHWYIRHRYIKSSRNYPLCIWVLRKSESTKLLLKACGLDRIQILRPLSLYTLFFSILASLLFVLRSEDVLSKRILLGKSRWKRTLWFMLKDGSLTVQMKRSRALKQSRWLLIGWRGRRSRFSQIVDSGRILWWFLGCGGGGGGGGDVQ